MNDFILREAHQDQDAILEVTLAAYAQYADVMPALAWNEYRKNIVETLARVAPLSNNLSRNVPMRFWEQCCCFLRGPNLLRRMNQFTYSNFPKYVYWQLPHLREGRALAPR